MSSLETNQIAFDDLELLAKVARLLTSLDLDEVLQKVVDLLVDTLKASRGSMFLLEGRNPDWQHLIYARKAAVSGNYTFVNAVFEKGLAGWVVEHKQPALIEETLTDARWHVDPASVDPARSALCVPLIYDDVVVAVLTLVHIEPGHFTERHVRVVTIAADQMISTVRQAQAFDLLRNQRRQLEVVLYTIPDAIFVLDEAGYVLLLNTMALTLLERYTRSEVIGRRFHELDMADNAMQPVIETIRTVSESPLETGMQWSFEIRSEAVKKDLHVSISSAEDIVGGRGGYVITMHDVTQLRDLHRFKDEMLRVASHDLRSPLSLIIGYIDLIQLDLPDKSDPIYEHLEVIRRSTERMNGLLDDLLRVERIRTSPLELHERIDPQKLIKVVLVNMRPFAIKKNQHFEAKIELDDAPGLVADPVLIRQAMENLIGNAIKYTPEYGSILVQSYVKNDGFYFRVQDTGMGISKEDLPYIFNSFYRVKSFKMQAVKGTGLGLSLVKTVIDRHHGEIWVESTVDEGSCFTFRIPLDGAVLSE